MLYESPNFRLESDDDVITLWLEFRGRPDNTVNLPLLNELALVLDRLHGLSTPAAIVIRSRNPKCFLEEFDIRELARMQSPLEFASLARRGQEVTRKLATLEAPTIAVIEGRSAGLGLEFALACDIRMVVDDRWSSFEFSELPRGLIPFCGAGYRLPSLVGIRTALRLWRDAKPISPSESLRLGLVDIKTTRERSSVDLTTLVDRLRERPSWRAGRGLGRVWGKLSNALFPSLNLPGSEMNFGQSSAEIELINVMKAGRASEVEGMVAERAGLARLSEESGTRRCLESHRHASSALRVYPEPMNPLAPLPQRIGIVGAGTHGTRLAEYLAERGHEIVVQHRHSPQASSGRAFRTTSEWVGFDNLDFVIEAVTEDPGEKRNIFGELEQRVRPRTILATASSTILVESVQAEALRPSRIVGLHLPNVGERSAVAEISATHLTHSETSTALGEWCREWRLTPILVADRPGRLVNVARHAYLSEGVALVAEGLPIQQIDAGCRSFGMSRGPLEWCDEIGFDTLSELTAHLQMARDDSFARNLLFQRLIPYGCVGKSVGEGFYRYGLFRRANEVVRMILWQDLDEDARSSYVFDPAVALREGIERLILRTVNEAALALADLPDSNPATVDLALAYGMGWAPRHGGPLRYADDLGLPRVVEKLAEFAERFGPRFTPCDELIRRAEAGESFYPNETASSGKVLSWRVAV